MSIDTSMAMPLYVHPDLRSKGETAFFWVDPATGDFAFSNGGRVDPSCLTFKLSDRLKAAALLEMQADLEAIIEGRAACDGSNSPDPDELKKRIAEYLRSKDTPENHGQIVNGETALEQVNISTEWPADMDVETFCAYVAQRAASNGMLVDPDEIRTALYYKLEEIPEEDLTEIQKDSMSQMEKEGIRPKPKISC